jgi:hypothetical protein
MPWIVENPPSLMVEMACELFNSTRASELPAAVGAWGINDRVWGELIKLTTDKCNALRIPVPGGNHLKGMCIWASVVTAKFYTHRFAYFSSRVVRVHSSGDHYFVRVKTAATSGICDITCNQFGGPNFIVGSLADVKGAAQKVMVGGASLYDAYALGAASGKFVI